MKTLSIILGSTRQQRFGETVAKWLLAEAKQATSGNVQLLDLRDFPLPFYDEPKTPSALHGVYSLPLAQQWHDTIQKSDAFIFVTPEYNHSYPAVLKNAIDYLFEPWHGKDYAILSYSGGPIGGARSATRLRGLLDYMGLHCHGEVNMPFATKLFTPDGAIVDAAWTERVHTLLKKFPA